MKLLRDAASRQGVRPRVAESPKTAFWALWTSACALGWVVGGAMSSNALTAMVGWGVAGLLQWGVIARALPRMRAWILLTALGGGIGVGTFAATEILLERYDPPALWEAMRAERVVYNGEPIILVFHQRKTIEYLEIVVRLEEEDGMVASLRSYGFCPEVMREIGETLGHRVNTGLYRYPTPVPGGSYKD